ncbi:hypothetical protein KM043_010989 [Ampulex compressa]|nr:hypothetical protein KM043_010989 [Ampulex compressa]
MRCSRDPQLGPARSSGNLAISRGSREWRSLEGKASALRLTIIGVRALVELHAEENLRKGEGKWKDKSFRERQADRAEVPIITMALSQRAGEPGEDPFIKKQAGLLFDLPFRPRKDSFVPPSPRFPSAKEIKEFTLAAGKEAGRTLERRRRAWEREGKKGRKAGGATTFREKLNNR